MVAAMVTLSVGFLACVSAPAKKPWDAGSRDMVDGDVSLAEDTGDAGGPLTCKGITRCTGERDCKDYACYQACMGRGSEDAQELYKTLLACQQEKCQKRLVDKTRFANYLFCLYTECKYWLQPCLPQGTATCLQIKLCVQECKFEEQCATECIWQGSYDAQVNFVQWWKCIEDNCSKPINLDTCIQKKCHDELAVCS